MTSQSCCGPASQAEINSTVSRDQVRLIEDGPGIARGSDGKPLISPEPLSRRRRHQALHQDQGQPAAARDRRTGQHAAQGLAITAGRMFNRGSNEVVVGKACSANSKALTSALSCRSAPRAGPSSACSRRGSVFESEIWADLNVVQSLFNRNNIVQTVRLRLHRTAALNELKSYSDNDPRLKLDVKSEAAYFAEQASQTSDLIQKLGWPLAIAMALARSPARSTTMYSSVAARATEIATLRRHRLRAAFPAFVGTLAESLLLAVIGGLLGAAATYLDFRRRSRLDPWRQLHPGGVRLQAQSLADRRGGCACADRRPDRRIVSRPAGRAIADRRGPLRKLNPIPP